MYKHVFIPQNRHKKSSIKETKSALKTEKIEVFPNEHELFSSFFALLTYYLFVTSKEKKTSSYMKYTFSQTNSTDMIRRCVSICLPPDPRTRKKIYKFGCSVRAPDAKFFKYISKNKTHAYLMKTFFGALQVILDHDVQIFMTFIRMQ